MAQRKQWDSETYRGYRLEAFAAMCGWEIQGITPEGRHAFTFLTPATSAAACLRHGRNEVDTRFDADRKRTAEGSN